MLLPRFGGSPAFPWKKVRDAGFSSCFKVGMTLAFSLAGCEIDRVTRGSDRLVIHAHARRDHGRCPSCGMPSSTVHSRFHRHPAVCPASGVLSISAFRSAASPAIALAAHAAPSSSPCPSALPGPRGETTGVARLIEGLGFGAFLGDKAHDADWPRDVVAARGAEAVIPARAGRKHPARHATEKYKWRQLVKRFFQNRKEFKRIAMPACKAGTSCEAMIHLAAPLIRLK